MNLSTNFTFKELTATNHRGLLEINRLTAKDYKDKLIEIACEYMEPIRALMGGRVMVIHSCFRCRELNTSVQSKPWSQHTVNPVGKFTGAFDFHIAGLYDHDGILETFDTIRKHGKQKFHQLIYEFGWIHYGLPTGIKDGQVFILDATTGKKQWLDKGEQND